MNDLFGVPSIETAYPIPTGRVANRRTEWGALKDRLPFGRLAIGDSFALHPADYGTSQIRLQNYLSGAACAFRDDHAGAWAFTTRQMADGTVRVWRIDPADAKGRGE